MPSVWVAPATASETLSLDPGIGMPLVSNPPNYFNGAVVQAYGYLTMDSEMWTIAPNPSISDYTVFRFVQTRPYPWGNAYPEFVWTVSNPPVGEIKFALADGTYTTSVTTTSSAMGARVFVAHTSQTRVSVVTVSKVVSGVSTVLAIGWVLTQEVRSLKQIGTGAHFSFNNGYESRFSFGYTTTLGDSPKVAVRTKVIVDTAGMTTQGIGSGWAVLPDNGAAGATVGPSNCNAKLWQLKFRAWNNNGNRNPDSLYTPSLLFHSWVQRYPLAFYITNSAGTSLMHMQTQLYLWVCDRFSIIAPEFNNLGPVEYRMLGD